MEKPEKIIQQVDSNLEGLIKIKRGDLSCPLHPGSCGFSRNAGGITTICSGVWTGERETGTGSQPTCPNRDLNRSENYDGNTYT